MYGASACRFGLTHTPERQGMGIDDPIAFDYMDAPDSDKIVAALRMLYLYGALDADGKMTKLGRLVARTLVHSTSSTSSTVV